MKPIKYLFPFLHKISVSGFITMLLMLTTGCAGNLQDFNTTTVQSVIHDKNKITADGYAAISVQKADTLSQQVILAVKASKLDAYKGLAEQVYGQYLDVDTTVSEMVVQSETFRAKVQGILYGAKVEYVGPHGESDDLYVTRLALDKRVVNDIRKLYVASMATQGSFATGL